MKYKPKTKAPQMKITFLILLVLGCCSCGREKPAPVKHIVEPAATEPTFVVYPPYFEIKRHWVEISDDHYHATAACVRNDTSQIDGFAMQDYPSMEPGIWYAEDGNHRDWASFPSRILAKREVERHLGGCPGITPIDEKDGTSPGKKKLQLCQIVGTQSGYREIECEQNRYWIDSQ